MGNRNPVDAREMASAPLTTATPAPVTVTAEVVTAPPAVETAAETLSTVIAAMPENRFRRILGPAIFSASEAKQAYDQKGGGKRKKILNVVFENIDPYTRKGSGVYTKGSVNGILAPGRTKPRAEFSFFGNQSFQSCLQVDDASAKAELEAFRAEIAAEGKRWIDANPQAAATISTDPTTELDGISF